MEKRTLKFDCLINMAMFSRKVSAGYLMNTNNFTLTGRFTDEEVRLANNQFGALLVPTTDRIFSYRSL